MTLILIALLAMLAALVVFLLRGTVKPGRTVRPPTPKAASIAKESLRPRVPVEPPLHPETVAPPFELPADLAAFQPVRHDALDAEPMQAIVAALRRIPRPPPSLRQLVSREFVSKATSPELSALVMGEPLIAAKVLAAVNSPFYGLQKSVVSIGQAVTFLGFNTVRSVGLRYMLSDSFKAGSPDLERVFNTIWSSSAFASELCLKLAQKLALADQGSLATHMVLSFIGRFATYSLLPAHVAVSIANLCLLERVKVEQAQLGLGSAEIGGLLMQEWALPPSIIQDVRDVDSILVTPPEAMDAERGARLALCYLCARLGERLAQGSLDDLAEFDLMAMKDADFFQLKSYLQRPALARLLDYLHAPDLLASLAQMQESMKAQK